MLAAPVTPFTSDWIHRALTGGRSVHLAAFPVADEGLRDAGLEADMANARALVSLGRAAREEVQIRVRQPLRTLHAVLPGGHTLPEEVLDLVKDELNVKEARFPASAEDLVRLVARPNFRALGPRFQERTEAAASAIRALDQDALAAFRDGGTVTVSVAGVEHALEAGDLELRQEALGELVVKSEGRHTVALDPTLDDELRREGLARELVNRIQRLRRDAGLRISDRIALEVRGPDEVREAALTWRDFIAGETLAPRVDVGPLQGDEDGGEGEGDGESGDVGETGREGRRAGRSVELDGTPAWIGLTLEGDDGSA
jgi:isoleucyl-tRNA synthetase